MTNSDSIICHLILLQDCWRTEGHTTGKVAMTIDCVAGNKYDLDEKKRAMNLSDPAGQRLSTPYLPQSRYLLSLSKSKFMGLPLLL